SVASGSQGQNFAVGFGIPIGRTAGDGIKRCKVSSLLAAGRSNEACNGTASSHRKSAHTAVGIRTPCEDLACCGIDCGEVNPPLTSHCAELAPEIDCV